MLCMFELFISIAIIWVLLKFELCISAQILLCIETMR